nr:MFS transporter [Legionella jordanis]
MSSIAVIIPRFQSQFNIQMQQQGTDYKPTYMNFTAILLVLALVFFEWLDFSLYLYLAKSTFAKEFFPASSYSLMLSFALFAAAYLVRPIGGWIFGGKADRSGRRAPMIYSAILMGLATLGICLLPTYNQVGLWATWGLLLLRMAQALALGGEINTSAMFLVEHHANQPLLAGSFTAASAALGMFTGGMLATVLQVSHAQGCWRWIFASVALLSLGLCVLRKKLFESPEFESNRLRVGFTWSKNWRGIINIAVLGTYVSVMVYICNVFWVSFAIDAGIWGAVQCSWIGSLAQLASAFAAIPIAYYSRPSQASRLLQTSMLILMMAAPLLFYFTIQQQKAAVLLCLAGYVFSNGFLCAALYYYLYLQLPTSCRCRGVSTSWALAASLGAISLPIAEQAKIVGLLWLPGLIVSATAFMAFVLIAMHRSTPALDTQLGIN